MISRYFSIEDTLQPAKTLVIYGPRRTGKTTLLGAFTSTTDRSFVMYLGDDLETHRLFSTPSIRPLSAAVGSSEVLVIDEAQAIPNIGKSLKLLNDSRPGLSIVVTGSASFELAGQIGEPLVGRKITRYLYPLSVSELLADKLAPQAAFQTLLPDLLLYGSYPSVITETSFERKRQFLDELVTSQLLKDILAFRDVKSPDFLLRLLAMIAYQIGNEVSHAELGNALNLDRKTIERYLDLLEKSFIIYQVGGYSNNLRSEITKTNRYYFYDNGIRNAIIKNYNPLEMRNDVGQLWENFVISERLKYRTYHSLSVNQYFWRTWQQQEIDLVEEYGGSLRGYEVKWSPKRSVKIPRLWHQTYPNASWQVVSPDNFLDFVSQQS